MDARSLPEGLPYPEKDFQGIFAHYRQKNRLQAGKTAHSAD
jgi:hypothetical protein